MTVNIGITQLSYTEVEGKYLQMNHKHRTYIL